MMQPTSKPWYREPWPWFLMLLPMSAVIASMITIWLAVKSQDGLVVDDYYKQGIGINKTLHRDQKAQQLGISAQLELQEQVLRLRLNARQVLNPESLLLHLSHPTQSGRDQNLSLAKSEPGVYLVVIKDKKTIELLTSQRWQITLEAPESDWRVTGSWPSGAATLRLGFEGSLE